MELEKDIPFSTEEGYEYLASFIKFTANGINYGIPIIDISIVLVNGEIEYNSFKTFSKFANIINDYLEQHNVILYYYCDTAPIKMRMTRKENLSPQEFRSKLFSLIFEQRNLSNYILREIRINDSERGYDFTCLISHQNNTDKIQLIENDLLKFNK